MTLSRLNSGLPSLIWMTVHVGDSCNNSDIEVNRHGDTVMYLRLRCKGLEEVDTRATIRILDSDAF